MDNAHGMQILQRRSNVQRHMQHFDDVHGSIHGAGSVTEPPSVDCILHASQAWIQEQHEPHVCPARITGTRAGMSTGAEERPHGAKEQLLGSYSGHHMTSFLGWPSMLGQQCREGNLAV
eukprot:1161091-Pelagomonas_calceolata.AAC.2